MPAGAPLTWQEKTGSTVRFAAGGALIVRSPVGFDFPAPCTLKAAAPAACSMAERKEFLRCISRAASIITLESSEEVPDLDLLPSIYPTPRQLYLIASCASRPQICGKGVGHVHKPEVSSAMTDKQNCRQSLRFTALASSQKAEKPDYRNMARVKRSSLKKTGISKAAISDVRIHEQPPVTRPFPAVARSSSQQAQRAMHGRLAYLKS